MIDLNERVTFQRKTLTKNEYGTLVESVANIATVWAKVTPRGGDERDRGQQTEADWNYTVKIMNRADLLASDRILWRGIYMDIRNIPYAGPRPLYLQIEAEAGVPA